MRKRHTYLSPNKGSGYTMKLFSMLIKYYYSDHIEEIRGDYDYIYIDSFTITSESGAEMEYALQNDR